MYSAYFDAKQCRDSFQQPHSCDFSLVLCSIAFRSSFIRSLLLGLNPCGGNNLDGMFPLFYKQVARKLVSKLAVIFRHMVKRSSFPACWGLTDAVPVPKGSPFSDVGDYEPISIIPFLSKVFDTIVAAKLSHFVESNSMFPPSQF